MTSHGTMLTAMSEYDDGNYLVDHIQETFPSSIACMHVWGRMVAGLSVDLVPTENESILVFRYILICHKYHKISQNVWTKID